MWAGFCPIGLSFGFPAGGYRLVVLACGPVPAREVARPSPGQVRTAGALARVGCSAPSSWAYMWLHLDTRAWSTLLDLSYGVG